MAKGAGNLILTGATVAVTALEAANLAADVATAYRTYTRYQAYQSELANMEQKAAGQVSGSVNRAESESPLITKVYQRPANATTQAQRLSVQGKSCVDCGVASPLMMADHKTPLVKEYYTTGGINLQNMRSIDAVQPQCLSCSNIQGGQLSNYSKQMKINLRLNR